MLEPRWLRLEDIERRVCDVVSEQLAIRRDRLTLESRLIDDLGCESLDLFELLAEIEQVFGITFPDQPPNPVYKSVFTRRQFRLADLAELVYLRQGSGAPERAGWNTRGAEPPRLSSVPFTQLGGRFVGAMIGARDLLEPLDPDGAGRPRYRRRSDGMRSVLIPAATVEIGDDRPHAHPDEGPLHEVEIEAFLIDAEPVSTTAYCRFLNSVGESSPEILADWFVLEPDDDRNEHMLVEYANSAWSPVVGTERWPMMLVSWYGANAYSLWANGGNWRVYRGESESSPGFLPTEAQWEYAARGAMIRAFPWGDEPPSDERMCYARHRKGVPYRVETLPMAEVNALQGMSPFGVHHMAGNVWQWCQDWYDESFYGKPESRRANPRNQITTQTKSERGGSWVGPASLCRSSFRRGRPPRARGRCLGFRCTSPAP